MRIVAGRFGGRKLAVPKGRDIRPTSDKIRGAVFNMLRSRNALEGAIVLDAFCGTGALGLEVLSQGAAHCTFMDKSRESLEICRINVESLSVQDETLLIQKDATKPGPKPDDVPPATLVFLDPPYNKGLIPHALSALHKQNWLEGGAFCILEAEKDWQQALPERFELFDQRSYGDTQIILARYQPITPE